MISSKFEVKFTVELGHKTHRYNNSMYNIFIPRGGAISPSPPPHHRPHRTSCSQPAWACAWPGGPGIAGGTNAHSCHSCNMDRCELYITLSFCCFGFEYREFRSCVCRGHQWFCIFLYHSWTAFIKPRLLFSPCKLRFLRTWHFYQIHWNLYIWNTFIIKISNNYYSHIRRLIIRNTSHWTNVFLCLLFSDLEEITKRFC